MNKPRYLTSDSVFQRVLSTVCALCVIISVLVFAPIKTSADETGKMFVIHPTEKNGENFSYANVFIPLNFRSAGGKTLSGDTYFKLTFKAKLYSTGKPIVGVIRSDYDKDGAYSEPYNVYNNTESDPHADKNLTCSYDPSTYTYTYIIKICISSHYSSYAGGVHSAITIGNMEHNAGWYKENSPEAYFAFAYPELYAYDVHTKNTYGENLIAGIDDETVNTGKTYFHKSNPYSGNDNLLAAPTNKWGIDTTSSLIEYKDIPEGFFDPGKHNYKKVEEVLPTETEPGFKEHYVCDCDECKGRYFISFGAAEVKYDDLVIQPNGADKALIIKPNISGDEYPSGVFIPLNFTNSGTTVLTGKKFFLLKFKAKINEGHTPIVSVVRYDTSGGSYSDKEATYNNQGTSSDKKLYAKYDAETETFSALIKLDLSNTNPANGAHSAIIIGKAEHDNDTFSENDFGASFIIYQPELYYYDVMHNKTDDVNLIAKINNNTLDIKSSYTHRKNPYNSSDNLFKAPVNVWSVDGPARYVSVSDVPKDFFKEGKHNFVFNAAKEPTETEPGNIQYYTCDCDDCKGKFFTDFGLTKIDDVSIAPNGPEQMITFTPNSFGRRNNSNVFIPIDHRVAGDPIFATTTHYYKLTFKAKLHRGMPIVSVVSYDGSSKGTYSEPNGVYNNDKWSDAFPALYSEYDEKTMTYTALIAVMTGYYYSTSASGAHHAILIGNVEHNGNWYSESHFETSFSFCNPELYLYDPGTKTTAGENIIPGLNGNTLNLGGIYKHASNPYTASNNLMAAPLGKWSVDGNASYLYASEIDESYFDASVENEDKTPQMILFSGTNNNEDQDKNRTGEAQMEQKVALKKNVNYQFSLNVKYADTGYENDKLGVELKYRKSGSFVPLQAIKSESETEYKEIYDFTMPGDADGRTNFIVIFNFSSAHTSGYAANFELFRIDDSGNRIGENLIVNGDFSAGNTAFWDKWGLCSRFEFSEIPENFFSKVVAVKPNMIIYRNPTDYAQFAYSPHLKPSTTYELKYRELHTHYEKDKPSHVAMWEFYYNDNGRVENSSNSGDRKKRTEGEYTYETFTTKSNIYTGGNNNIILRLYMRAGNAGYWGPVELYEVDAKGEKISNNLILNGDFTCGYKCWEQTGDFVSRTAEIPDGFFSKWKAPTEMIYSNGTESNQTYGQSIALNVAEKYYFSGYYVNMNSVGVNPQIQYLSIDGTYKDVTLEVYYDSARYFFETAFEIPGDALLRNGVADVRVQINNYNKGKGYFAEIMLCEDGKYINLLSAPAASSDANYKKMAYNPNKFVFYYDDTMFESDGDWSGEWENSKYNIKTGRVTGMVADEFGMGISGLKMRLEPGNITVTTNENGAYFFDSIRPGVYNLYLMEQGGRKLFCLNVTVQKGIWSMIPRITYSKAQAEIDVDSNDGADSYDDGEYGILRGFYYNREGVPIKSASIRLRGIGRSITDENGMFVFDKVPPGTYDLYAVSKDGTEYVFRKVKIEANRGIQVKIKDPPIEENTLGLLWIIVIIGGATVILAGLAFVIILIIKKRKKQNNRVVLTSP